MEVQSSVNVVIAYDTETNWGEPAAAGGGKLTRRVSSTLTTAKDTLTSNEVRPDQQVADLRHGTMRAPGSVEGELSLQTYDDWLEALLRGTWAAGVSLSETQLTSVAFDAATSKCTFGGGDPVALGLRVGDVIRYTGVTEVTNNNKNFRITAFGGASNRDVSITPAPTTATADVTFTVAVTGKKLTMGLVKRSFTLEQRYQDIDISERFDGMRVGQGTFRLPPNAMAGVSWEFLGRGGVVLPAASSPYFTNPTAAPDTGIFAGPQGSLRVAGVEQQVVTGLDFSLNLNLATQPVVGSNYVPGIFYGRSVVTGTVMAMLENETLIQDFINEQEVDITTQLTLAGVEPLDFITFRMQRVKFSGYTKTVGPDNAVIVSFPFQALLKAGGSGHDQSTMVIQRSNA